MDSKLHKKNPNLNRSLNALNERLVQSNVKKLLTQTSSTITKSKKIEWGSSSFASQNSSYAFNGEMPYIEPLVTLTPNLCSKRLEILDNNKSLATNNFRSNSFKVAESQISSCRLKRRPQFIIDSKISSPIYFARPSTSNSHILNCSRDSPFRTQCTNEYDLNGRTKSLDNVTR